MALSDIDTIIVVILENRSFDHLLGYLSVPTTPDRMAVEGLKADPAWIRTYANLYGDSAWPLHRLDPEVQAIDDPQHNHAAITVQVGTRPAGPGPTQMGGFVDSYARLSDAPPADPGLVMGYYDAAAVPVFDFFARNYAVCDHWFAALPCGTQPNRLMAMAGESQILDNAGIFLPDQPLAYDWLTAHGVRWCAYQAGGFFPFFSLMERMLPEIVTSLTLSDLGVQGRFRRYRRFAEDWAAADSMPSVVFIEPEYSDGPHSDPNDDHPPTGIAKAQAFLADIYGVLISNPARWAKAMMIVTYDEHGGFFDHVPPLPIPAVVAGQPIATTGVRVPALVVSPQVAAGSVFTGALDHTSILQLFDDKFSPGAGYSVAVNARQAHLNRLENILIGPAASPRAPAIPADLLAKVRAAAAAAVAPPAIGAATGDPPNAQALHQVAVKAQALHPELVASPGWAQLSNYLAATNGTPRP